MNRTNVKNLLIKATGFLSVTSLSVLISLPGYSQQSPANTSPAVPSTVKPTNPGGRDAGTTNGGEDLNRVPSSGSTTQQNSDQTGGQNGTAPTSSDPATNPSTTNRVEGRDQSAPNRINSSPNSSSPSTGNQPSGSQPGANQPGATTGGDSSQQVEQNQSGGSTMQQNRTTPQNRNRQPASTDRSTQGGQSGTFSQPGANQPGATTGGDSTQQVEQNQTDGSTTQQNQTTPRRNQTSPQSGAQSDTNSGSGTAGDTSQQQPSNGGVRALW